MPKHSLGLALVVLGSLSIFGCQKQVPKAEVEKQAMATLTAAVGQQAPQITCPGDLKAEVGATMTCSMPIDGKNVDVNVKVTSVDGSSAKFDVAVADKPS